MKPYTFDELVELICMVLPHWDKAKKCCDRNNSDQKILISARIPSREFKGSRGGDTRAFSGNTDSELSFRVGKIKDAMNFHEQLIKGKQFAYVSGRTMLRAFSKQLIIISDTGHHNDRC